ncbi:MAG: hypothetical protein AAF664_24040, partial [Planctomycetota bacterium]
MTCFRHRRSVIALLLAWFTSLSLMPPVSQAGDPIRWARRVVSWPLRRPVPPEMPDDPAIDELARNLDWVEQELGRWGTVSAKGPDIWGEARLTKYRREIEEQLAAELGSFDKTSLQGAQVISDQAMMAAAVALRGSVPTGTSLGSASVSATTTNVAASGEAVAAELQTTLSAENAFGLTKEGDKIAIDKSFELEQVQQLDQLNRYLNHLAELRRINEGDDTADSPGYALNLVRMPASVIPGNKSKRGHGAEIEATIEPYLGPELLPIAFRDFVINDLVDQLSLPLTKFINSDPIESERKFKIYTQWKNFAEEFDKNFSKAMQRRLGDSEVTLAVLINEFREKEGSKEFLILKSDYSLPAAFITSGEAGLSFLTEDLETLSDDLLRYHVVSDRVLEIAGIQRMDVYSSQSLDSRIESLPAPSAAEMNAPRIENPTIFVPPEEEFLFQGLEQLQTLLKGEATPVTGFESSQFRDQILGENRFQLASFIQGQQPLYATVGTKLTDGFSGVEEEVEGIKTQLKAIEAMAQDIFDVARFDFSTTLANSTRRATLPVP